MALVLNGSGITSANIADGTIVNADINSSAAIDGTKVSGSFGKVLQVVSTTKTDTFTTTSTSFVDVTGLSVAITPSSTSSKILVFVDTWMGNSSSGVRTFGQLVRGSTLIHLGDSSGSRSRASAFVWADTTNGFYTAQQASLVELDSPSTTSSITYKYQLRGRGGTSTLNRAGNDADADYSPRLASTITVMEIGA